MQTVFQLLAKQPPEFGREETIGNAGFGNRRMFYDTTENILVVTGKGRSNESSVSAERVAGYVGGGELERQRK